MVVISNISRGTVSNKCCHCQIATQQSRALNLAASVAMHCTNARQRISSEMHHSSETHHSSEMHQFVLCKLQCMHCKPPVVRAKPTCIFRPDFMVILWLLLCNITMACKPTFRSRVISSGCLRIPYCHSYSSCTLNPSVDTPTPLVLPDTE